MGKLVVFEGISGSGKSYLISKIKQTVWNVEETKWFDNKYIGEILYEADKVQKCKDISESVSASSSMQKYNSIRMNKSEELFVDNFVIVQASQEIAFDTSDVISALQYEDIYYIQYKYGMVKTPPHNNLIIQPIHVVHLFVML